MIRPLGRVPLAACLALAALAGGCHNSEQDQAAKEARAALGVQDPKEKTTTTEKRDVVVIHEEKVVDPKTGQVLSDKKTETPVSVETQVKTNVDVNVGQPTTGAAPK